MAPKAPLSQGCASHSLLWPLATVFTMTSDTYTQQTYEHTKTRTDTHKYLDRLLFLRKFIKE